MSWFLSTDTTTYQHAFRPEGPDHQLVGAPSGFETLGVLCVRAGPPRAVQEIGWRTQVRMNSHRRSAVNHSHDFIAEVAVAEPSI